MNSKGLKHWQKINILLVIFDIFAINFAYFFALFLRFDFSFLKIPEIYIDTFIRFAPIYTIISLIVFYFTKMYRSMWRFASTTEIFRGLYTLIITGVLHVIITYMYYTRMPISYYVVGALLQFILTTGIRFSYRVYLGLVKNQNKKLKNENVLIIGAGEAGRLIYNDMKNYDDKKYIVKGFIDDNSNKWGRYLGNTPIIGDKTKIEETVKNQNITLIIIAIPSASIKQRKEIIEICKETGAKLKILPSIPEILENSDNINIEHLKDVQIEDLLEREAIEINSESTLKNIKNKVVMVTGGGGTIGSELCRQIARNNPKMLIIFDIYENSTYEIEQELRRNHPELNFVALIGSVREALRLDDIFDQYRPEIVYHAAAHKHVPLMETSPNEAIKNNIYGTYNTAFAALRYKAERFILISTDKAVNPTSIMGTTKRACEMIIQSMNQVSKTKDLSILPELKEINHNDFKPFDNEFVTDFVAVRFGNVLGSNGSVIPLFKKQILEGGPVTVTHKDIIRYFMTISEAVGLVIEAGFYAKGGEIFVLDMGEPVKIDTLARNLIKLSGLKPDVDIEIKYVGLRPGEKLYEEKLMAEEGLKTTPNKLIHVAKPIDFNSKIFFESLEKMSKYSAKNNINQVLNILSEMVPTYHTPEEDLRVNKEKFEELYNESK